MLIKLSIALCLLSATPKTKPVPKPIQPPSQEAVKKAEKALDYIYAAEMKAARTPTLQCKLADDFLAAAETMEDAATRFILLRRAQSLGAKAGDTHLAIEATEKLVASFLAAGLNTPEEQFQKAEKLWKKAKGSSGLARREIQIEAVEWYLRAKPHLSELSRLYIDKRIVSFDFAGASNADLKLLVGVWDVHVGNDFRSTWTFYPDGTVSSTNGAPKGSWTAESDRIKIVWNEKAWDCLSRPLNPNGVTGDSWAGVGIVRAKKVADLRR